MKEKDLMYPDVDTYFIAHSNDKMYVGTGVCTPKNQTTTGLDNFLTFIDKDEYAKTLLDFDIIIDKENDITLTAAIYNGVKIQEGVVPDETASVTEG